jgi:hypothetical protein
MLSGCNCVLTQEVAIQKANLLEFLSVELPEGVASVAPQVVADPSGWRENTLAYTATSDAAGPSSSPPSPAVASSLLPAGPDKGDYNVTIQVNNDVFR